MIQVGSYFRGWVTKSLPASLTSQAGGQFLRHVLRQAASQKEGSIGYPEDNYAGMSTESWQIVADGCVYKTQYKLGLCMFHFVVLVCVSCLWHQSLI